MDSITDPPDSSQAGLPSASLTELSPTIPDLTNLPAEQPHQFSPNAAGLPFGYVAMNPAEADDAAHGGDSPMPDVHNIHGEYHSSTARPLSADDEAHFATAPSSAPSTAQPMAGDTVMDDAPSAPSDPTDPQSMSSGGLGGAGASTSGSHSAPPGASSSHAAGQPQEKFPWVPIVEDHSSPGEDELARLRSKGEISALDQNYWQRKAFKDLGDPDFAEKADGIIHFDIHHFNGTRDSPNSALVMHSAPVWVDGLQWRLRVYPKGNGHSYVSAYLVCETLSKESQGKLSAQQSAGPLEVPLPLLNGATLSKQDDIPVQMTLVMYNPGEPRVHHHKSAAHRFSVKRPDRGFHRFGPVPWTELGRRLPDSRVAMVKDDRLSFVCHFRILYDPTGFLFDVSNEHREGTSRSFKRTGLWPIASVGDRRGESSNLTASVVAFALLPQVREAVYMVNDSEASSKPLVSAMQAFLCDIRRPTSMISATSNTQYQVRLGDISCAIKWHGQSDKLPCCNAPICRWQDQRPIRPTVKPWHPNGRPLQDFDPFQVIEFLLAELLKELADNEPATKLLDEVFQKGGFRVKMTHGTTDIKKGLVPQFLGQQMSNDLPQVLHVELPRQEFDEEARRWKTNSNRIPLLENLRLGTDGLSWYSLYGLILHHGDYHARCYTTILRPNGTAWYKFTDAYRSANDRLPQVTRLTKKQALHDSENNVFIAIYMRNDVAARYMFRTSPLFSGHPESKWTVPERLKNRYEMLNGCDYDGDSSEHSSAPSSPQREQSTPGPEQSPLKEKSSMQEQSEPECSCPILAPTREQEQPMDDTVYEMDYLGSGYYRGTYRDGYRHGWGKRIYPDGDCYEGEFQRDLRSGSGRQVFRNGDVYEGSWKDDKMEGQGEYTTKITGATYRGGFENGIRQGKYTISGERAEALSSCLICYEVDRDAVFYPCGHLCACLSCARRLDICPYCSRTIGDSIRLYTI